MSDVPISNNITINFSVADGSVAQRSFKNLLILSSAATAIFSGGEYVREYSTLAELAADGFSTSGETYLAASAILAQTPHPTTFKIGAIPTDHTDNTQTITWSGDFVASNAIAGSVTANGSTTNINVNFTSDQATTITAVATAIDAIAGVSASVTGSREITVVADPDVIYSGVITIGNFTVTGGASQATETVTTTVAGTFEGSWLNDISGDDSDWYCLLYPATNASTQAGANRLYRAAGLVETASPDKVFIAQSAQASIASGGASAITTLLAALNYNRTAIIYHETTTEHLAAGWASRVLARDIDTRATQWARVHVSGITAGDYTTSERSAIVDTDSYASYYASQGGSARTFGGTMASGRHIDVQTTIDLTTARLEEGILGVLNRAVDAGGKVPYTNAGVAIIAAEIRAVFARLEAAGHWDAFVPDDNTRDWLVVPDVANATSGQRSARTLPAFEATRTLAGAVYNITINAIAVE